MIPNKRPPHINLRHELYDAIEIAKRRYCDGPNDQRHKAVMDAIETYRTAARNGEIDS